jgi:hypothetical protein
MLMHAVLVCGWRPSGLEDESASLVQLPSDADLLTEWRAQSIAQQRQLAWAAQQQQRAQQEPQQAQALQEAGRSGPDQATAGQQAEAVAGAGAEEGASGHRGPSQTPEEDGAR